MNISKSRFVSYCQCPKKLWLEIYHPELADEMDQTIFKNGTMVGELAQGLFPGGYAVKFDHEDPANIARMISKTQELMGSKAEVIYEAAFKAGNLLAICDILVRGERIDKNSPGGNDGLAGTEYFYDIYEVKSSTQLKEVHILDVGFQQNVLGKCGVHVQDTYIVHIDNQYVRHGELDLQSLFDKECVTELSSEIQNDIESMLPEIDSVLEARDEIDYDIGLHCSDPYDCQFCSYCWRHIPSKSVFNINNLHRSRKFDLYQQGIITFEDLRKHHISLKASQLMQIEAELDGVVILNRKAISSFLKSLHYPLYFLDFETFMPPVPLFEGTRPYQQIPSQYSLHHIDREGGTLHHDEFLAQEGLDPRLDLTEHLIAQIPIDACVLAYNMAFEKGIIRGLAEHFPQHRGTLTAIHDNIRDLMDPFKNKHYYIKEMEGKFSIKNVLPALFPDDPELSYKNLGLIHNGSEAMNAFAALQDLPPAEREQVRQSLLDYCRLDTLAMVRIWEKLQSLVRSPDAV